MEGGGQGDCKGDFWEKSKNQTSEYSFVCSFIHACMYVLTHSFNKIGCLRCSKPCASCCVDKLNKQTHSCPDEGDHDLEGEKGVWFTLMKVYSQL